MEQIHTDYKHTSGYCTKLNREHWFSLCYQSKNAGKF